MDEKLVQFRVGVMVIGTLICAAILVLLFGELPSFVHGQYTIFMRFQEAPGVMNDTPIRKSGILIGRVTNVELEESGGVVVTARINGDVKLRTGEKCCIKDGFLGDSVIQVVQGRRDTPYVEDGGELEGTVAEDPMKMLAEIQRNFSRAFDSVGQTSEDLGEVVRKVNKMFTENEKQITRIIRQTDETLAIINRTAEMTDDLISDDDFRKRLKESIHQLPDMITEARDTIGNLNTAVSKVDKNLENIEGITEPLGKRGPMLVDRIDTGLERMEVLMEEMVAFGKMLNNSEGAFSQFANNPDLYQSLNRAAINMESITRQLRPIVSDARVITDKLARHPGIIIRDAIRPGPGIK